MSTFCYNPLKGIDDVIADKVNELLETDLFTPYRIAILRGMYDQSHTTPVNTDDIDSATETIISYNKELHKKNLEEINKAFDRRNKDVKSSFASLYKRLKENIPDTITRNRRIELISYLFSQTVDLIQEDYPELTREEICNGKIVDGEKIGGQGFIFNEVFDKIISDYEELLEQEETDKTILQEEEYIKILNNFTALSVYARFKIRDSEGLKLGLKLEYASKFEDDDFGDNPQTYNEEEATRESWQEESDKKSAFGSLSSEIKRFLGDIQAVTFDSELQEYVTEWDDLDYPVNYSPTYTYSILQEILFGATSSEDILTKLEYAKKEYPWISQVIASLQDNPNFLTKFYTNFHKGNQLYSIMGTRIKKGITEFFTKIINGTSKDKFKTYIADFKLGKTKTDTSIYDEKGNVNWENLLAFRDLIKENFTYSKEEKENKKNNVFKLEKFYDKKRTSFRQQYEILRNLLSSLGFSISDNELTSLLYSKSSNRNKIIKNLVDIAEFGIEPLLTKDRLSKIENKEKLDTMSFDTLFRLKTAKSNSEGLLYEKVEKIAKELTFNTEYLRRAKYTTKEGKTITYDSYVTSSFMSDFFGKIKDYYNNRDKEGLQKFIEDNYLCSSQFYGGNLKQERENNQKVNPDLILNQWLKELYADTMSSDRYSFSNYFSSYERHLGIGGSSEFEDYTSNIHIKSLLRYFYSDKEQGNPDRAHYPVFIMGDSNVSKFITAKIYNEDEILDGFYNIYKSEIARMKLAKKSKILPIVNFTEKSNEFSILTFLNDAKYKDILKSEQREQDVKKAIKDYLDTKVVEFKNQLRQTGALEQTKTINNKGEEVFYYTNFGKNVTDANIDKEIRNFYFNTKFALANQLQMFVIDPSFYKNTKDLQKRFKEIHAPGNVLDINALDSNDNKYSELPYEQCLYFNDIILPANKDFLNAIEANLGGTEGRTYKKYLKNSLTDGQGYRTLSSYRKVAGMAGIWTSKHEEAYNKINALRDKYKKDEVISKEDLAEITKLAVVFQPLKPFMFTHEHYTFDDGDTLLVGVQHKYAEIPLIPELLPNSMLKDLAYYMEDNNIDMVCSNTVVKTGEFGTTDISSVKNNQELKDALSKGVMHKIKYSDYRLQTNVTDHMNTLQLFGTQLRKLIMSFVDMHSNEPKYAKYVDNNKVNLGGKTGKVTLNGRNLIAFYNSLITANILESFETFRKQITDPEQLSDILSQNIVSNSRESLDNLLAYSLIDGEFTIPLFEGGLEHDATATLFSLFKKAVNKQKIKGGSLVQASALGLTGYQTDGDLKAIVDNDNNVLYVECETSFDLSYTDSEGNEVKLNFEDYCNPDGTLILGKEIDSNHKDYYKYLPYQKDGKVYIPKIEEEFPNILSMIAYRIPTEKPYSMINLRIKRFTPSISGGVIKVPVQWTTITGFDFDIDKLYFIRREYKELKPFYQNLKLSRNDYNKVVNYIQQNYPQFITENPPIYEETFSDSQLYNIFREVYEKNSDIYSDLSSIRTNSGEYKTVTRITKSGESKEFTKYDHPLNYYFDQSSVVAQKALNEGFETITAYKQYLVSKAANDLGYTPEVISIKKDGYISLDLEAIRNSGITARQLFEEAGNALGIQVKENINSRFDTYDYNKPVMTTRDENGEIIERGNSRIARNNMLVSLIEQRLMDKETFKDRYTPSEFVNSSNSARIMRELFFGDLSKITSNGEVDFDKLNKQASIKEEDPEPNYDPTDIMTIVTYNQQNQVASKLIGIFANQNINYALSTLMQKFYLKKDISFCGHSYNDLLNSPDGIDVSKNMAEFLAASVDAVKDPVLNFLNLNTTTADAGALLVRLGYTTTEVGLLFNQPIIKQICEYAQQNNIDVDIAIRQIVNDYKKKLSNSGGRQLKPQDYGKVSDAKTLANNILYDRKTKDQETKAISFLQNQLVYAELFNNIVVASKDVSKFVTSSKFTASNAVGSTAGDFYAQQMKVNKYLKEYRNKSFSFVAEVTDKIDVTINNDYALLNMSDPEYLDELLYNPFSYEQAMYDMNRKCGIILNKYLPYNTSTYRQVREKLASLTRSSTLNADTINSIHRDLLAYLLTQEEFSAFNGDRPLLNSSNKEVKTLRDFYVKEFPQLISKYQLLLGSKYAIFNPKYLSVIADEDGNLQLHPQNFGDMQSFQKEEIKDSWESLYKEYPEIAKQLFYYNFYMYGFNMTSDSFMHEVPTELKRNLMINDNKSYIEFLKEVLSDSKRVNLDDFAIQYTLNHLDNKNLVYTPKGDMKKVIEKFAKNDKGVYKYSFELDITSKEFEGQSSALLLNTAEDEEGKPIHYLRHCIILGGNIYISDGDTKYGFNVTNNGKLKYVRVDSITEGLQSTNYKNSNIETSDKASVETINVEDSSMSEIPENNNTPEFNPMELIEGFAKELKATLDSMNVRDNQGELYSLNDCIALISTEYKDDYKRLAEDIKKACRQNGLLVLDEEGNITTNC